MTNLPTTARALIERSLAMHPTLYVEAARNMAAQHRQHAAATYNDNAARSARCMAYDCDALARVLDDGDVDAVVELLHLRVPAVTIAAKLQCLPPYMARELVDD